METEHVQVLQKIGALKIMKHSERLEIFEKVRAKYSVFLLSVLWKLTGDKELFTEAMQYTLMGMWQHIEKLNGNKAGAYIYRIALTANSRAWRNRIGRNGDFARSRVGIDTDPSEKIGRVELTAKVRRAMSQLPGKQGRAIVMRYLGQEDYQTIAEKLRCSKAGARSHVSKALAALKDKLAALAE
jgi:RNA polymerase sigma factor (sigma-70 family)